jgi:hypothetical protein
MLIHFEIRGKRRWEALGSGESAGDVDPLQDAIDDLRSLHGGVLPGAPTATSRPTVRIPAGRNSISVPPASPSSDSRRDRMLRRK